MIEAIVGLSVLLVGMLGIINLLTDSMRTSDIIASQFVAANLAAEGIEVTKNIIDDLIIKSGDWNFVLNGMPDGTYEVDYRTQDFGSDARRIFTPSSQTPLTLDYTTLEYGYSSDPNASVTPFRRSVTIAADEPDGDGVPTRIAVNSRIDWTVRGRDFSTVVSDQFYRWRL